MPRILRRLAEVLAATDHLGNPVHVARKRLFGKSSDLLTVADRNTHVRCTCNLGSHHMFSDVWYTHIYDITGVPLRPGDVAIDIGANQGFFTCYAANKGARVFAFEPVPEHRERLSWNVRRNGFSERVVIQECAVSSKNERATLYVSASHGGGQSSIIPEFVRGANVPVLRTISVACKTLPEILNEIPCEKIRLCKIDAEGAELRILRTLTRRHAERIQSFALEYHENAYDVRELLRLIVSWGTHQVSFMDERPYNGHILRAVANTVLLGNQEAIPGFIPSTRSRVAAAGA